MLTLPPIPSWQAMHPLIVHFPIALLLIAPLFVVIGVLRTPERGVPYMTVALILMILGTVGTYVAAWTGETAGQLAESVPQARGVLEQHEELAVTTELAFTALTLIFASILLAPRAFNTPPSRTVSTWLPAVFLLFYATGAISLANTAHQGGRLVHEIGVRAQMQKPDQANLQSAECE
jgi:uncharacterized membrane protein